MKIWTRQSFGRARPSPSASSTGLGEALGHLYVLREFRWGEHGEAVRAQITSGASAAVGAVVGSDRRGFTGGMAGAAGADAVPPRPAGGSGISSIRTE